MAKGTVTDDAAKNASITASITGSKPPVRRRSKSVGNGKEKKRFNIAEKNVSTDDAPPAEIRAKSWAPARTMRVKKATPQEILQDLLSNITFPNTNSNANDAEKGGGKIDLLSARPSGSNAIWTALEAIPLTALAFIPWPWPEEFKAHKSLFAASIFFITTALGSGIAFQKQQQEQKQIQYNDLEQLIHISSAKSLIKSAKIRTLVGDIWQAAIDLGEMAGGKSNMVVTYGFNGVNHKTNSVKESTLNMLVALNIALKAMGKSSFSSKKKEEIKAKFGNLLWEKIESLGSGDTNFSVPSVTSFLMLVNKPTVENEHKLPNTNLAVLLKNCGVSDELREQIFESPWLTSRCIVPVIVKLSSTILFSALYCAVIPSYKPTINFALYGVVAAVILFCGYLAQATSVGFQNYFKYVDEKNCFFNNLRDLSIVDPNNKMISQYLEIAEQIINEAWKKNSENSLKNSSEKVPSEKVSSDGKSFAYMMLFNSFAQVLKVKHCEDGGEFNLSEDTKNSIRDKVSTALCNLPFDLRSKLKPLINLSKKDLLDIIIPSLTTSYSEASLINMRSL